MAARLSLLIGALTLLVGTSSCFHRERSRFDPLGLTAGIDENEERELGFRFDREIQGQVEFIDDLTVLEFVDELGQAIVRGLGPQPFLYRFRVIQDPTLNAFAVPGGYVYLHSGTVLGAGSLEELAGVVAHEIAHVKGRHYARLRQRAAIPDLLAGVAAMAIGVATQDARAGIAVQAANEALKLRYTREFEAEADRLGAIFLVRAGYDPDAMVRFFERLLAEKRRSAIRVPPYLFTHPQVEERIQAVSRLAERLRPLRAPPADLATRFPAIQARVARLLEQGRSYGATSAGFERTVTDPALERARVLVAREAWSEAVHVLEEAEGTEPRDPRLPFERGRVLEQAERWEEAVVAYRRTLELDPSRALVLYRLGRASKRAGQALKALFFFEQAARRAGPDGALRSRAERAVELTVLPVFVEHGLGKRVGRGPATAGGERASPIFPAEGSRIVWWGRLVRRLEARGEEIRVAWIDPRRDRARTGPVEEVERGLVRAALRVDEQVLARPGTWRVEAHLGEEIVDTQGFEIRAP